MGNAGGLVGRNAGGGAVTASYWDTAATGRTSSAGSAATAGKTAAQLREPTDYEGIYADWNRNLDGETGNDDPWDFGQDEDYPILTYGSFYLIAQDRDYDRDDDNLIDIYNLAQLDAVRHDASGQGNRNRRLAPAYYAGFAGAFAGMGCADACVGYELRANLDFDENGDGAITETGDPTYWNEGAGFRPLPAYTGTFIGNGHTISNMFMNYPRWTFVGLFQKLNSGARAESVGLLNAKVSGAHNVGALTGYNAGAVSGCYAFGTVAAQTKAGGLVAHNDTGGTVTASYATVVVSVTGTGAETGAGGLVGINDATITASYSNERVPAGSGGLAGSGTGTITNGYHDSTIGGAATATTAKTSLQLAGPTEYGTTGIYAAWNVNTDGVNGNDDPWHFGTDKQYPVLQLTGFDTATQLAAQHAALAPAADAGEDQTTFEQTAVTLDASASSDPQGQAITYAWTQGAGGERVTLSDATAAMPTFTTPELADDTTETLTFALTVNDGLMDSTAATVTVTFSATRDYDDDDDGLIDIRTLAQLDAVRYDLDGDGAVDDADTEANVTAYTAAFSTPLEGMGCQLQDHDDDTDTAEEPVCAGYELRVNLTFDLDDDGDIDADDYDTDESGTVDDADADAIYWNGGAGWRPIGGNPVASRYAAAFEGNGHTISRLFINRGVVGNGFGLFDSIGASGKVTNLGIVNARVDVRPGSRPGALAGYNYGLVEGCYSSGRVSGGSGGSQALIGGLVGYNDTTGTIRASYSTAEVHSDEGGHGSQAHIAGGLAGYSHGTIVASFATGPVKNHGFGGFIGGGLVGLNTGTITSSYAAGAVSTLNTIGAELGGLVGQNAADSNLGTTGAITDSYALGRISGSGYVWSGGLIGRYYGGSATNTYWDRHTTRLNSTAGNRGASKRTDEMQSVNGYTGIYASWNRNLDGVAGNDDPWEFGSAYDYPILKFGGLDKAPQRDYDRDDDNLIDLYSLTRLDAIRYDLDGDGVPADANATTYETVFTAPLDQMGCPDGCAGYELGASLDFDTDGDGSADSEDQFWDGGKGWQPIGSAAAAYDTAFAGNGLTLSNLFISRGDAEDVGLFGAVGSAGSIYGIAMLDAGVTGSRTAAGNVGALAGRNGGQVAASFVTGSVSGSANDSVGGLVGRNASGGRVSAVYGKAAVSAGGSGDAGGIVGYNDGGTVSASYGLGAVSGGGANSAGGVVGRNGSGGAVSNVYWDTTATGQSGSAGSAASGGKTAAQLQAPTGYAGIYAGWDVNLDGSDGGDTPWDFGIATEYPALIYGGMENAPQRDYDRDDDNLIDIHNLARLDAVRYDLDGNGVPAGSGAAAHRAAYAGPVAQMGCPDACVGYELRVNLDFDENGDDAITETGDPTYWDGGKGWQPIGGIGNAYNAKLIGNGHTIDHLFIARSGLNHVGLIGQLQSNGRAQGIGLHNARVTGNNNTGALVGYNAGAVSSSYAFGAVSGAAKVGGLVAHNVTGGSVTAAYATVDVTASGSDVGALVGHNNNGTITASYANGRVFDADGQVPSGSGGLAGTDGGSLANRITNSYHDSIVAGITGGTAKTSLELARPTAYGTTGIYAGWNVDADETAGADNPWDFGTNRQYPALRLGSFDTAAQFAGQTAANKPPTAEAGANESIASGGTATLDGTGSSDPEAQTITYAWTQTDAGPRAGISNAAIAGPTVTAPAVSALTSLTFSLVVDDGVNFSPPDTVTITVVGETFDYDDDGNGLIDIRNTAQLNAMRYDLNGDGVADNAADNAAYAAAFPSPAAGMGCPRDAESALPAYICSGYELRADLDFDENDDNVINALDDDFWNDGKGWAPVGSSSAPYTAAFRGNGKTVSHLYISRSAADDASELGLFGALGSSSSVTNLGLPYASVSTTADDRMAGILAGSSAATVSVTYAQGSVSASGANAVAGGLVGRNSGTITAVYASAGVSGGSSAKVGGLVGENRNRIAFAYAAGGAVSGGASSSAGGLAGVNTAAGRVGNSYWDREASGQTGSAGSTNAAGKTTAELLSPTGYTGIYSGWNINLDADTADDNPWHFGIANQYPALRFGGHDTAVQFAIQPDRAPSFGTASAAAQNYLVGVTVSETLPAVAATSGNGAFTYALTGPGSASGLTLPDGLRYTTPASGDAHGGTIAGVPSRAAAAAQYTLTVRDGDGNTAAGDTAALTFSIGVTAADTMPAGFSFDARSDVAPGTVVTSNAITVSGINTVASISVTNGELIVDGSAFSGDTIRNGQTVAVKVTASAALGGRVTARVTIGGVSADFVVNTRAAGADASLSALSLTGAGGSAVALNPAFAAGTTTYDAITTSDAVTVSAAAADANAAAPVIAPADSDAVANGHQVDTTGQTATVTVSVTAEDGVTTRQYTITVTRENDPPTALAGSNRTVAEGAVVTLSGSGTDPEQGPLTYAWSQVDGNTPSVDLTNANTARASFTAPTQLVSNAVLVFELTVTDNRGATNTDTATVTITVTAGANDAPTANAGGDFTVGEGAAVTLRGSGTDPERETLSYAWSFTSGTPSVTLANASTANATFTAPTALTANAALVFTLTVTDGRGAAGTDTVTVTVTASNTSPTADAGSDRAVAEGVQVTLNGSGSDTESQASDLTYSWAQTDGDPSVDLTNANTATATFTAPSQLAADAELEFTLTVTDPSNATGSATVTITVTAGANDAPTASAGGDRAVAEGAAVTLVGSGTDPEMETLSYSWSYTSGTPSVTLDNANTANATFTAPTQLVNDAVLVFTLTVTDPGRESGADPGPKSGTDTVTITVTAGANDAPTAVAGNDRSVSEGEAVTLAGRGSDPENETLSYAWSLTSGTLPGSLSNANTATASFTAPTQLVNDAVLVFTLTVTDTRGESGTDTVTITVTAGANDAPTADAGANRAVAFGAAVTLSGSGSDPEDETLSYSWRQTSGSPTVSLSGANTATASFNAPTGHSNSISLVFELTVTDARNASATDTVTITVTAADTTPAAFSFTPRSGVAPSAEVTSNTITVSGIDTAVSIRVTNGSLVVNGADFSGATVTSGQRVAVKVTASSALGQSVTATLTIGTRSSDFVVTTRAARTDAALRALSLTDGGGQSVALSPSFSAGRTAYAVTYTGLTALTVAAAANDSSAGVSITPADSDSEAGGHQVTLVTIGDHTITVRVTAEDGTTTRDYTITATRRNAPHTVSAGSNRSVAEGAAVSLTGSATDPDNETLSYAWSLTSGTLPGSLSDANTATATFTAPTQLASNASLGFKLTVTDPHGLAVSDRVTITVTAGANDAPTANAGSSRAVSEGAAVTLSGSGTDPENETLSYRWRQQSGNTPSVSLSDANTAAATFTAPTQLATNASLVFELTVTDARGASGTATVTITVTAGPNDAPTANAGGDRTVGVGAAVTLAGSGTDPENETLSYRWQQQSGSSPSVTLSDDNTANARFTAPSASQISSLTALVFELTVTDARGLSDTDTVTITVTPGNQSPVANAGSSRAVSEGAAVTLSGSATDADHAAGLLTYSWRQTDGDPRVTLSNANTATARFTAPSQLVSDVSLTFELTVTDPDNASGTATVVITVTAGANDAPTANAGGDRSVSEGAAVTLAGSGTDPENETLSYSWRQSDGSPTVSLVDANAAAARFTAPAGLSVDASLVFELTVTDNRGAFGADTVTITVTASAPANQLRALTLTAGGRAVALSPDFDGGRARYTAVVDAAVASVTVAPAPNVAGTPVTVNGTSITPARPSVAAPLEPGDNLITVVVSPTGGIAAQTYTIAVQRPAATPTLTPTPTPVPAPTPAPTPPPRPRISPPASGTVSRTVGAHTFRVTGGAGIPDGVVVFVPRDLDRDVTVTIAPPANDEAPPSGDDYGIGTIIDITVSDVPAGGLEICLPAPLDLRRQAGRRQMLLLHYDGQQWRPVAGSETRGQQQVVCAAGISDFSFYTVGYQDSKPAFAEDAVGPTLEYLQGITDASAPLPAAAGGDTPLDYRITPPLPKGLSFNPDTRVIFGAPAATLPRTEYILTAIDYDGAGIIWDDDTATLPFTIRVGANLRPSFAPASAVAPQVYAVGDRVRLELPAASGGNGALTYRLAPRLPAGLYFDAATRAIAGVPTTSMAAPRRYTLVATDADRAQMISDEGALPFTLTIAPAVPANLTATPGAGAVTLAWDVPADAGVVGYEVEYRIAGASAGSARRVTIEGRDTAAAGYAVTGLAGNTRYAFRLRAVSGPAVQSAPARAEAATLDTTPSFGNAAVPHQSYKVGDQVRLELPAAAGGDGALTYTLTPELPAGLTFDPQGPAISGQALAASDTVRYRLTAADADGSFATLIFTIEVVRPDTTPSFGNAAVPHQTYTVGDQVRLALPAAAGGDGALTYTLTPELPAGLTFDPLGPAISGQALAASDTVRYRLTAADADGSLATLIFTIEVVRPADTEPGSGTPDTAPSDDDDATPAPTRAPIPTPGPAATATPEPVVPGATLAPAATPTTRPTRPLPATPTGVPGTPAAQPTAIVFAMPTATATAPTATAPAATTPARAAAPTATAAPPPAAPESTPAVSPAPPSGAGDGSGWLMPALIGAAALVVVAVAVVIVIARRRGR